MLEDEKKEEEEPAEENIGMNITDHSVCNGDILCIMHAIQILSRSRLL